MIIIIAHLIHYLFLTYTLLLLARVIASWIPRLARHRIMHFICFYTDPYLNLFRRLIPPIGGALDLSPMLGFFVLQILEKLIMGFIRGLL
ncbi:MAG TPA: YggT family protein [Rhabdochlamydiaceae bacterium]|nr:YggT family protein [Rhabdochlamydiaceae bacterium]